MIAFVQFCRVFLTTQLPFSLGENSKDLSEDGRIGDAQALVPVYVRLTSPHAWDDVVVNFDDKDSYVQGVAFENMMVVEDFTPAMSTTWNRRFVLSINLYLHISSCFT